MLTNSTPAAQAVLDQAAACIQGGLNGNLFFSDQQQASDYAADVIRHLATLHGLTVVVQDPAFWATTCTCEVTP